MNPKKRIPLSTYDPILKLWKDKEDKWLAFNEIKSALESQEGWYERKIIRYLNKMVKSNLLTKQKEGQKGSRSYYRTTTNAHEYEMSSFFTRVREESHQSNEILEYGDAYRVYGIPNKKELTLLENEILEHILDQINNSFFNLHTLKKSIIARKKVGEPLDELLVRDYLLEKGASEFTRQIWHKVYDVDTEDIKNIIKFSKDRGVNISNPEKYLEIEKRWDSPNVPVYKSKSGPLNSFEESCLALLVMLNPNNIAEYGYDSFNYLKYIILLLEGDQKEFTDSDLIIFARDFLLREKYQRRFSAKEHDTKQRIQSLRNWAWLKIKLGTEKTEKLAKIAYYLWKNREDSKKPIKTAESSNNAVHIVSEEEQKKKIDRIIGESQKINF